MLVLIPNPNQLAQLVKMQKAFIKEANAPQQPIFYQNTPLWIFLPEEKFSLSGNKKLIKDELKELSQSILKVELEEPRVYFSENLQRVVLGSHSRISTESGLCSAELILCDSLPVKGAASQIKNPPDIKELSDLTFPMQLKIFRLADAEELAPNTWAVNESVWRKIK